MTDPKYPPLPVNIRAVMPDGEIIPVECCFAGFRRGKWRWVVAWPLRELPVRIDHDVLPDGTTILVNTRG